MQHKASNFSSQAGSEEVDIADQCEGQIWTQGEDRLQSNVHTSESYSHRQDHCTQLNRTLKTSDSTQTKATFDDDNVEDDIGPLHRQPPITTPNLNRSES